MAKIQTELYLITTHTTGSGDIVIVDISTISYNYTWTTTTFVVCLIKP